MECGRNLVAVAAIVLLAGCGPERVSSGSVPVGPRGQEPATVQVVNHNWSDVRVFLVYGAQRVRLGTVMSMRTETLRVPSSYNNRAGSVQLAVVPLASREAFISEPLTIRPGQQFEFRVQNHLAISSVAPLRE